MTAWLDPLAAALAAAPRPVPVFFRNDDAGWDDAALVRLLDVFAPSRTPIDLAVIPSEARPELVAELLRRREDGVRVHQHGATHANHEAVGRKCEFGPSRTPAQRQADIVEGQRVLRARFGDALDPVFTPPWNRCEPDSGDHLAAAGIAVLSRDATAPALGHAQVREVRIDVDWFGKARGERWTREELGRRLAAAVAERGRLGVMLHHAVTSADDLAGIAELVRLVAAQPAARRLPLLGMLAA